MKCSNIRVAPSQTSIVREETNLTETVQTSKFADKQQNKIRPRTEPCGTPPSISSHEDIVFSAFRN